MHRAHQFIAIVLLIILGTLGIFFRNQLFSKLHFYSVSEISQLKLENESLKSQLPPTKAETISEITSGQWRYHKALVYSSYPINNQKLLAITLGEIDGIAKGMAVAVVPGILVGQVTEVFPHYSFVRTIFDTDLKLSLRIGTLQEEGLLEGGNPPAISFIKDKKIASGENVYSAGLLFPYGLKLGTVGRFLDGNSGDYFKRVLLDIAYRISDLREVYVITNYVPKF